MTEPVPYQGMSPAVLGRLLALVVAYDRKFSLEELDIAVFHRVAIDYRWTAHEVETAIHKWGATEAAEGFMSPAKLNDLIRTARQDKLSRAAAPSAAAATNAAPGRAGIIQAWVEAAAGSKTRSQARRALVLKHEDLRQQLCARPLEFRRAEEWNGWIPPELTAEGARNTSYRRAALVEIVAEAERREAT